MSYGLAFSELPEASVERVRREQLEAAAESLQGARDPVEAIHDARKRIKKTRALLRLARPGLKPKAYRRRNRELRDAGRQMSDARDADVLVETVDALAERFVGRHPERFFTAIRDDLASSGEANPAAHASRLRALARDEWTLRQLDADALADSIDPELQVLIDERRAELLGEARALGRRVYAEGPKAFARRVHRYLELAGA